VRPNFYWKRDEASGSDIFQVVWINLIKICRLKVTEDKKYKMEVIKK
jgi:hypothetical protein